MVYDKYFIVSTKQLSGEAELGALGRKNIDGCVLRRQSRFQFGQHNKQVVVRYA
jgi:hypothetical protein